MDGKVCPNIKFLGVRKRGKQALREAKFSKRHLKVGEREFGLGEF